jgi:hypothetical protein
MAFNFLSGRPWNITRWVNQRPVFAVIQYMQEEVALRSVVWRFGAHICGRACACLCCVEQKVSEKEIAGQRNAGLGVLVNSVRQHKPGGFRA